jgi:hypothetical protein
MPKSAVQTKQGKAAATASDGQQFSATHAAEKQASVSQNMSLRASVVS